MSMMLCFYCDAVCDTDHDPEGFADDDLGTPRFVCRECRGEDEGETE
jgi:hypothetical protein